jgi:hypothetical protein
VEIQAFLIELIGTFEFAPTKDTVLRAGSVVMQPVIAGEMAKGAQLPLRVLLATQD